MTDQKKCPMCGEMLEMDNVSPAIAYCPNRLCLFRIEQEHLDRLTVLTDNQRKWLERCPTEEDGYEFVETRDIDELKKIDGLECWNPIIRNWCPHIPTWGDSVFALRRPRKEKWTFEDWEKLAHQEGPAMQVGPSYANHLRSMWRILGVPVYEDDVFPYNFFKRPSAWCHVDLQLLPTDENIALVMKHGGTLGIMPYSEERYWPCFTRTPDEYDNNELDAHMRRVFSYLKEYQELKAIKSKGSE